jgi:hypothetical protein
MKNKNLYLKIILTVIAILLTLNIFIRMDIFHTEAHAVTQTSEFQDRVRFLLGSKSNIVGNLMVLEYPGKGIYYINLDQIESLFEGENHVEFKADGSKFKVPKPDFRRPEENDNE